jgi:hypothetical protein
MSGFSNGGLVGSVFRVSKDEDKSSDGGLKMDLKKRKSDEGDEVRDDEVADVF